MFIYLDETFNLKKGSKKQFLAIAGFSTLSPNKLSKLYYQVKSSKLPRKLIGTEVKSTDRLANKLIKPKLFEKLLKTDIEIYCNLQYKNQLSTDYFPKGKLNYDFLYLDLLTDLLVKRWNYKDQRIVILTLDTFKTKKINKGVIIENLKDNLNSKYPDKLFKIEFESSTGLLNLEIADFICSIFHDHVNGNNYWKDLLKSKLRKITFNPLN